MKEQENLLQILNDHMVTDLKTMAKEFNLKGHSKMKKNELATLLYDHIFNKEYMELKFILATDQEIELFEKAMKEEVILEENEYSYRFWHDLCFAFTTTENVVKIPSDIQQEYLTMKQKKEYIEARNRFSLIENYAMACTNLYAIIEVDKFIEIINSQTNLAVDSDEVVKWCGSRLQCRGYAMYFYHDGYIMDDLYGNNVLGVTQNYKDMLVLQGEKPYYIPEKQELLKYEDGIYIEENESFQNMVSFVMEQMKRSKEEAYDFCAEIQLEIRDSYTPKDIIEQCNEQGLQFISMKQMNSFMKRLIEMFHHTRIPEHRGFTANEIVTIMPQTNASTDAIKKEFNDMGFSFQKEDTTGEVVLFAPVRRNEEKVYPNDSCPCGSGKKYKKCCAKK